MQEKSLYPMKFTPILKTKIWGGERIHTYYRHDMGHEGQVGESWDLSDLEGDESVVENGFLAENTIGELTEVYMGDLVGDIVYEKFGNRFPLLVKLIDASEPLSIQVHPDHECAERECGSGSMGKNEMWYVLNAEPGAYLWAGFNHEVTVDEIEAHLATGTLESLFHKIEVKRGDVVEIPAGTVHSIGKGCTLVEIQNASDITYRLYDFNRIDTNGCPRQLHTDLALESIDYKNWSVKPVRYEVVPNEPVTLVKREDFTTNLLYLTKAQEYDKATIRSFVILVCVEGHVTLKYDGDYMTMVEGETMLVPAEMNSLILAPTGEAKLLEVYI